jgi:plasmid stability protein
MAQLLVRNLADDVKHKLRRRAEQHGRSMEEEARCILAAAVSGSDAADYGWASRFAAQCAAIGFTDEEAAELELRGPAARPAELE